MTLGCRHGIVCRGFGKLSEALDRQGLRCLTRRPVYFLNVYRLAGWLGIHGTPLPLPPLTYRTAV